MLHWARLGDTYLLKAASVPAHLRGAGLYTYLSGFIKSIAAYKAFVFTLIFTLIPTTIRIKAKIIVKTKEQNNYAGT